MSTYSELDRLLDWIRTRCPGSSDAEINKVFYEVAYQFFNDTSAWLQTVQFQTVPNVQSYPLVAFPMGQPIRLVSVYDQNNIPYAAAMPLGIVVTPNTTPPQVAQTPAEPGTVQLRDNVTTSVTLFATFVMNVVLPTDGNDCPQMPDYVLQLWGTVFQDGVLGYMFTTPGKPYKDLPAGQYSLKKFRDGIARARTTALRMQTQGTQNWWYPQEYRTYSRKGGVSVGNWNGFF